MPEAAEHDDTYRVRIGTRLPEVGTVLVTLIAGLLSALVPWWGVLGLVLGITVVALTIKDPLIGLLLTLALAAQAIPGALVPTVPLGGAQLLPCEIVLLLTFASCLLNGFIGRHSRISIDRDFLVAALLSLVALLVSIVISKFYLRQHDFVFPVLRNFLPLALLPLLPSILSTRQRVDIVENAFIAFGVLIALFIAIQAFTGIPLLAGRLEDLGLNQTTGITRTVLWGPELLIILSLFLIGRHGLRHCLTRVWPMPALAILLLGLMGTYTRSFWIATAVAAMWLALFANGLKGGLRLAAIVVPMCVLLGGIVLVVNPRIGEAAFERAFGITQEIQSGESFGWRGKENAMAIASIAKSPWFGIGFNGAYKPAISLQGHFEGEDIYIHNAYLYFQLKMGLLGSTILMVFLMLYLRLSWAAFGIADRRDRVSALSYVALGIVVLMIGYSGQTISRFVTLLLVCLMFAIMKSYAQRD